MLHNNPEVFQSEPRTHHPRTARPAFGSHGGRVGAGAGARGRHAGRRGDFRARHAHPGRVPSRGGDVRVKEAKGGDWGVGFVTRGLGFRV